MILGLCLCQHCPHIDLDQELGPRPQEDTGPVESSISTSQRDHRALSTAVLFYSRRSAAHTPSQQGGSVNVSDEESSDSNGKDDPRSGPTFLSRWLSDVKKNPSFPRLFGKSGTYALLQTAFEVKREHTGDPGAAIDHISRLSRGRPDYWDINTVVLNTTYMEAVLIHFQWEARDLLAFNNVLKKPVFEYPDEDLIPALVDAYFDEVNIYAPLLHRPTFEAELASDLHLRDRSFAAVLLSVCALGSLFSDDPRVFINGVEGAQSAGWKWFRQVTDVQQVQWGSPSLYDLQLYSVSCSSARPRHYLT